MSNKYTDQQRIDARATLLKLLKPGTTVYTILRHVSSSGMTRIIDPILIDKHGHTFFIQHAVAVLTDRTINDRYCGIKVSGCGMDMGFELVYILSRILYPAGFRLRKGQWHNSLKPGQKCKDGGYALKQRWL